MSSEYYRYLLQQYGPTFAAMDCGSEYTHARRLRVLTEMIPFWSSTILDVGCGAGHLIDYGVKLTKQTYHGIDVLPDMIAAAQARRPGWHFEVGDIAKPKDEWQADYVLASGLFQFGTLPFVEETLTAMFKLCRLGVGANFLRTGDDGECIVNPLHILRHALTLSRYATLRIDYLPNDFTLYLYKEQP